MIYSIILLKQKQVKTIQIFVQYISVLHNNQLQQEIPIKRQPARLVLYIYIYIQAPNAAICLFIYTTQIPKSAVVHIATLNNVSCPRIFAPQKCSAITCKTSRDQLHSCIKTDVNSNKSPLFEVTHTHTYLSLIRMNSSLQLFFQIFGSLSTKNKQSFYS